MQTDALIALPCRQHLSTSVLDIPPFSAFYLDLRSLYGAANPI